jgi:hypothetical protein
MLAVLKLVPTESGHASEPQTCYVIAADMSCCWYSFIAADVWELTLCAALLRRTLVGSATAEPGGVVLLLLLLMLLPHQSHPAPISTLARLKMHFYSSLFWFQTATSVDWKWLWKLRLAQAYDSCLQVL